MKEHLLPCAYGFIFFLVGLLVMWPAPGEAQMLPSFVGSGVTLTVSPNPVLPRSKVTVSLDDFTMDGIGADIVWHINGGEVIESRNERSVSFAAGKLGEVDTVSVTVIQSNGARLSDSVDIKPTQVDVILEADTYVPDFYKGRALPSRLASMRAIALVHDGTETKESSYTYKWSQDGTVLFGGPVKGKNVIEFTMPEYEGRSISVEVYGDSGEAVGRSYASIRTYEPELHFYEHSPLRGLRERTVSSPLPLIGEEVTIYGEPYFMNSALSRDAVEFSWEIDGTEASALSEAPNAIALRHAGGTGSAYVNLRVLTKARIPQVIERAFEVFFE